MSVDEALIQLKFAHQLKAVWVAKALQKVTADAVNNFNMSRGRLYVARAISTKGTHGARMLHRAKGRIDRTTVYRANAELVVQEQPVVEGERRVGLRGPTFSALSNTMSRYKDRMPPSPTA